jgi:hypothetical protein
MTATPTPSVAQINAVVAGLIAAHPEAALRIARGADLVEAGAVEPTYGGIYLVVSASDPTHAYAVIRVSDRWTCDCLDARQRGCPCKHCWATVIFQAAERLDAEASDPTVIPFPTPAYDPDADRFELTAKGEVYLSGAAEPPLA